MKNKVIIPEDSGLNPRKHKRALEILAQVPLDFLAVLPESKLKFYPKIKLTSSSRVGGINWSHLNFCLESPFYKLNFYGRVKYKQDWRFEYDMYSESRRTASLCYMPRVHKLLYLSVSTPNNFTFIIEVCPKKFFGPDGKPLFLELI